MPSGAGGSPPGRGRRAKAAKRSKQAQRPSSSVAMYKRLPHGPHRLPRQAVIRHQRTRLHGAMVEAVARSGYERTSVKDVIGLAGVSRRSFYELFGNKQECFLATFDAIAWRELQRMRHAYIAGEGPLEERLRAPFDRLTAQVVENRKAASLALLDAQTAGAAGMLRVRRATATCERMLARSLQDAAGAVPLPAPVVRAIVGGLHGAIGHALRTTQPVAADLSEEMLRWTLGFQTPAAAGIDSLLSARLSRRMREVSLAGSRAQHPHRGGAREDERARLMHAAMRLTSLHDYRSLTAPQIADDAGVPVDAFLDVFATRDECYLAALDEIGERLVEIASDPGLSGEDWPGAVRRVMSDVLGYLAGNPLHARTLAHEAFAAGEAAVRRAQEVTSAIAVLLTQGAPAAPGHAFATEAIGGALMHTVRCQVLSDRIAWLGVLADHMSYVVLAPTLGAEAALEAIAAEVPASDACEGDVPRSR